MDKRDQWVFIAISAFVAIGMAVILTAFVYIQIQNNECNIQVRKVDTGTIQRTTGR